MAEEPSPSIPSGYSRKIFSLYFINNTSRKVNILWVDNLGEKKYYGTLDPHRFYDINYFERHPWICEDAVTRRRMLLNDCKIFYPMSSSEGGPSTISPADSHTLDPIVPPNGINGARMKRSCVPVTLPGPSMLCEDTGVRKKCFCKSTSKGSSSTMLPRTLHCYFSEFNTENRKRQNVIITQPVFTLQELTSEVIINSICKKEDIDHLEYPPHLKLRLHDSYFVH